MSFLLYIATDVLLFLLAVLTLPLWLPFWAWIQLSGWYRWKRFCWECEQRMDRNAKKSPHPQSDRMDGQGEQRNG